MLLSGLGLALVPDFRKLAMHRNRRAHDLAAERIADRLMAEADAEDGNGLRRLRDQIEADAGFFRRAGTGRKDDGFRVGHDDVAACHLIVAVNDDIRAQFTEIVHQVEGEAVVIVDKDNHAVAVRLCGS